MPCRRGVGACEPYRQFHPFWRVCLPIIASHSIWKCGGRGALSNSLPHWLPAIVLQWTSLWNGPEQTDLASSTAFLQRPICNRGKLFHLTATRLDSHQDQDQTNHGTLPELTPRSHVPLHDLLVAQPFTEPEGSQQPSNDPNRETVEANSYSRDLCRWDPFHTPKCRALVTSATRYFAEDGLCRGGKGPT
jgi:hypothetical protein